MTIVLTHALKISLQALLVPNPGNRVEDFIFDKIEKKKPQRLSNFEYLGEEIEGNCSESISIDLFCREFRSRYD
jgi:hypothetical protein